MSCCGQKRRAAGQGGRATIASPLSRLQLRESGATPPEPPRATPALPVQQDTRGAEQTIHESRPEER
jgi:hypothetical protein